MSASAWEYRIPAEGDVIGKGDQTCMCEVVEAWVRRISLGSKGSQEYPQDRNVLQIYLHCQPVRGRHTVFVRSFALET